MIFSVLGPDLSDATYSPTNSDLTLGNYVATANANGITLGVAYDIFAAAGTVNAGWTRGAGVPGPTADDVVLGMVFPHL